MNELKQYKIKDSPATMAVRFNEESIDKVASVVEQKLQTTSHLSKEERIIQWLKIAFAIYGVWWSIELLSRL